LWAGCAWILAVSGMVPGRWLWKGFWDGFETCLGWRWFWDASGRGLEESVVVLEGLVGVC
jgi:hypothetical protein